MRAALAAANTYEVAVDDCEYARPNGEALLASVYRPRGAGPFPMLVDVHGGAWRYLDRSVDAFLARDLAARGLVVLAIDFRQAPAHRYPTAVEDVSAGVRFAKQQAARFGGSDDGVGLIGGSSGGHLALLAALQPDGAAPPIAAAVAPPIGVDARVAYVVALWPIADPAAPYRYLLERLAAPRPARDRFFDPQRLREGHEAFFGDEATMLHASVPRLLTAGEAACTPPLWVAHPEWDENVTLAMSETLTAAYRAAGGAAELVVFPGVGHAFANFGGAQAENCMERVAQFIAQQLGA